MSETAVASAPPEAPASHDEDAQWRALFARRTVLVPVSVAGVVAAALVYFLTTSIATPAWTGVMLVLPALCVADLATRLLPTALIRLAAGYALVALIAQAASGLMPSSGELVRAAVCAAIAGALYFAMFVFFAGGLGFGDVRLAVLLGAVLGLGGLHEALLGLVVLPPLLGVVVVLPLTMAFARPAGDERPLSIPFGPAMIAAAVVAMFCTDPLWGVIGAT